MPDNKPGKTVIRIFTGFPVQVPLVSVTCKVQVPEPVQLTEIRLFGAGPFMMVPMPPEPARILQAYDDPAVGTTPKASVEVMQTVMAPVCVKEPTCDHAPGALARSIVTIIHFNNSVFVFIIVY